MKTEEQQSGPAPPPDATQSTETGERPETGEEMPDWAKRAYQRIRKERDDWMERAVRAERGFLEWSNAAREITESLTSWRESDGCGCRPALATIVLDGQIWPVNAPAAARIKKEAERHWQAALMGGRTPPRLVVKVSPRMEEERGRGADVWSAVNAAHAALAGLAAASPDGTPPLIERLVLESPERGPTEAMEVSIYPAAAGGTDE